MFVYVNMKRVGNRLMSYLSFRYSLLQVYHANLVEEKVEMSGDETDVSITEHRTANVKELS